jgi:protein-disulfide isomerase
MAQELGLDMTAFRKALDDGSMKPLVQADLDLARQFNVTGTPTFALNGRKFSGALPVEQFKQRIDQAILEAKKLVDQGVARADVYTKLTATGSDRAVFLPMPAGTEGAAAAPPRPQGPPPMPTEVKDVRVESWNPTRGPANAKITLVVFCEYLCPFCKRVQATLKTLQQYYGNDLRIVFKHHIVHPPAEPVSLAAIAANNQGKFEELHAIIFDNQGEVQQACYNSPEACRASIDKFAAQVPGLDLNRLHADMDSAETRQRLDADKAAAASSGAGGTPSLFINGRLMVGAQPPTNFGNWIDQLLGRTTPTVPASADPVQQGGGGGGCGAPRPAAPAAPPPPAALAPVAPPQAVVQAAPQVAPVAMPRPRPPRTPRPAEPAAAPAEENPY